MPQDHRSKRLLPWRWLRPWRGEGQRIEEGLVVAACAASGAVIAAVLRFDIAVAAVLTGGAALAALLYRRR